MPHAPFPPVERREGNTPEPPGTFRLTEPPPWGVIDMILILALFFLLPGWIRSGLSLVPGDWRDAYLAIHERDLPEELRFTKKKDAAPSADPLSERPPLLRQTLGRIESSGLFARLRNTAIRLRLINGEKSAEPGSAEKFRGEHPLTVLILVSRRVPKYGWILAMVFVTAVITAPVTEELIFRVVLTRGIIRYIPSAAFAVLTQAVLFALIHIRPAAGAVNAEQLNRILYGVLSMGVSHVLLSLFILFWLRRIRRAAWRDFGLCAGGNVSGVFKGLLLFAVCWPVMIAVQQLIRLRFPDIVPDPAPIFILALGLGILFLRTGRFTANLAMHMALNLVSFCGILLMAP